MNFVPKTIAANNRCNYTAGTSNNVWFDEARRVEDTPGQQLQWPDQFHDHAISFLDHFEEQELARHMKN